MKIIPLSEGSFSIDATKQFVPFNADVDELNARPVGSLLVEINPFVVITSKDVLLLDTGLGFTNAGEMQLLRNLKAAGIDPASITKVLMSHLHKDHAGAVTMDDDRSSLLLPNATWYVQRSEFEYAMDKGLPSYIPDEFAVLGTAPNVIFLEEEQGTIDGYIDYQITGAHSKFHQIFWIRDEEELVFFGADDAPQLSQMKKRYAAKYDFDGKKAMELRQEWWVKAQQEKWTFLFYHDIRNPVYQALEL